MSEPKCPRCETAIVTLDETPLATHGAGDVLVLSCPSCHVAMGVVKARPVERVFEDAGRQAADLIGKLADKMQPR